MNRYRVAAAAKRVGLSPHTLRVWERRYGPFASARSEGGNRLYGERDLERLALLKRLVDSGHAVGDIAGLGRGELQRMAGHEAAPAPAAVHRQLLDAVRARDAEALDAAFARACLLLRPRELMETVVSPLLEEIGEAWSHRALDVAHEHAATAALRNQLGALLRTFRAPSGRPAVLVTTPEGDPHEMGALGAAVVAAAAGHRVVYLGPSMPAADLAAAARESRARAVLLSCAQPARERLRELRKRLPPGVALIAGGPGAPSALPLRELELALAESTA